MVEPEDSGRISSGLCAGESYRAALCRFDRAASAGSYPTRYGNGWRDRREVRSIRRALCPVTRGSHVLDLACGTGRLLDVLLASGFRVTCADASAHMVRAARRRWEELRSGEHVAADEPAFSVRDVMQTGFSDREFDAVICNRLFHHLWETEVRIRALRELRRISRGPVIVSFFNAFSLGSVRFRLKHALRRSVPQDRKPIPAWAFLNDLRRAGLTPVTMHGVLWGISPLYHVVSVPMAGRANGFFDLQELPSRTAS